LFVEEMAIKKEIMLSFVTNDVFVVFAVETCFLED